MPLCIPQPKILPLDPLPKYYNSTPLAECEKSQTNPDFVMVVLIYNDLKNPN